MLRLFLDWPTISKLRTALSFFFASLRDLLAKLRVRAGLATYFITTSALRIIEELLLLFGEQAERSVVRSASEDMPMLIWLFAFDCMR